MDSAFLNLVRGNRLSTYMGLTMEGDTPYRFSQDYTYVEIPLGEIIDLKTEKNLRKNAKIQAGDTLRLVPACTLSGHRYKCLVTTNPSLQKCTVGTPAMFLVEPGEGQPSVTVRVDQDCTLADLLDNGWVVRLYLLA